jgi:hypothetical protein
VTDSAGDPGATRPWWDPAQGARRPRPAWANALPFRCDIGLVGIEPDAGSAEFRMERPASHRIPTAG